MKQHSHLLKLKSTIGECKISCIEKKKKKKKNIVADEGNNLFL